MISTGCSKALSGQFECQIRGIYDKPSALNLNNLVNFNRISCHLIPFDSSLNALSNIFWVQVDRMKCLAGDGRNNTRSREADFKFL